MITPTVDPELDFSIEKPDWVALKILLEEIEEELTQRRKAVLFSLSNWFLAVEIFRKFEDRELVLREPKQRDMDYHRAFLTHLMAHGERLLLELQKRGEVDPKHIGVELSDVVAAVEELRLKFAEWYQGITEERRGEILREVFGGQE